MINNSSASHSLADIGWRPLLQQQLTLEELDLFSPARVIELHRSEIELVGTAGSVTIALIKSMPEVAVGDWVLLNQAQQLHRVLERFCQFARKAPGSKVAEQIIAANVDTALIVCSLNDDFNLNRIERFLSMVNEAGAEPCVVLSKADLCCEVELKQALVQDLDRAMPVIAINGLKSAARQQLLPWCNAGQTLVLLGSSGAGKSTLTNTLLGEQKQLTAAVRLSDSKGKHTTTSRSMLQMSTGAMLLDTPGMRELQLVACEEGIAATFSEVEALVRLCKFSDCGHLSEPGCAVQAALNSGELNERRFVNYQKLLREQAKNSATLAQRRKYDKNLGQFYKRVIDASAKNKRGE
ncbi:MAG: ribosome biogenesis GTPase [Pseudohongiellaceae bacterium]|jgi:ribosome biogenesis GTPase